MDSSIAPIRVAVVLTFNDYLSFEYWRISRHMPWLGIAIAVLAAIVLTPLLIPILHPQTANENGGWRFPWATLQFIAACFILLPILFGFRARKQWNQSPQLREPITYVFDDEGLQFTSGSAAGRAGWDTVVAVHERKRMILLQTAQNLYYPILLAAFARADDLSRLRELVKRKVRTDSRDR